MLELPPTVRIPREDETPPDKSVRERLKKYTTANIVEGYSLSKNLKTSDSPLFDFYAEINVNNSRLWNLVSNLASLFPENLSLIFGYDSDHLFYGNYREKHSILTEIEPFKRELVQDGFMEWGLIYHDENRLVEIFVKGPKYLQCWGDNLQAFLEIIETFGLNEIPNLEFIDEYPKVIESLWHMDNSVYQTSELIEKLKEKNCG
ncbi:hypothetical protein [Croceimicrobium hydrocarbonivorans]|uniref:Uncharacterized protein n=1 Tax=Croceimicrobium hydrocarbonivorans TaxID=2761580 RepID=A0A7H0VHC8_9FLAO|nr:hypothetical protein [Croceimicrobium hydrocarbonivorans]QNR25126.1 hypothetical protein H4K34_04620 [Croceimicrobium hydrocarbonivorans]